MMSIGKIVQLNGIIEETMAEIGKETASCIVINERGLIVAGRMLDGSSSETFAAMISLLSDTALRISGNLKLGSPRTASVKTQGVTVLIYEFLVLNRQFRIGVVMTGLNPGRSSFFRRRMTLEKIENSLDTAAREIRHVLEGA